jgi:hypothetical protein
MCLVLLLYFRVNAALPGRLVQLPLGHLRTKQKVRIIRLTNLITRVNQNENTKRLIKSKTTVKFDFCEGTRQGKAKFNIKRLNKAKYVVKFSRAVRQSE